ncbi:MAG: hypothetical protein UY42_C0001G0040 [Parcubacteria group bacterium GW2011_GWA2_49_16]|nr:MAG: hypothetical protein UY42_C0001G0040 [Parcubacteria group bacterium GW2011_GWA2_49_16]
MALSFILLLAIIAIASGFYLIGVFLLFLVVVVFLCGTVLIKDVFEFWSKMPTVWQSIPETLELSKKCGFSKDVELDSILEVYGKLEFFDSLFELRIDEEVIAAFEREYLPLVVGKLSKNNSARTRISALIYFSAVVDHCPFLVPEIEKAVLVRKKVGGKKENPPKESELSLKLVFT